MAAAPSPLTPRQSDADFNSSNIEESTINSHSCNNNTIKFEITNHNYYTSPADSRKHPKFCANFASIDQELAIDFVSNPQHEGVW